MPIKQPSEILKAFQHASTFLNEAKQKELKKDVNLICQQLSNPNFGIAVFAPFNFGKSTLINSLLGSEVMPAKIVRTTGAAVKVTYGPCFKTIVTLKNGEIIEGNSTDILKEFAVLNRRGKRREDLDRIEVSYPHRLLENGIEFFDLPGTNDSEVLDILVKDQLLQVDLVIQLIDAKQPFTMLEKETLHNWLINRGVKKVIFVLNKVNQLETKEEQKEVYEEVSSAIKELNLKSSLGIKNLYRVDALPALKQKQQGNFGRAVSTGIVSFEAALLTIIETEKHKINKTRLPKVIAAASQIHSILQARAKAVNIDIKKAENERNEVINKGKQRESYFKDTFRSKLTGYRDWLQPETILASYQTAAAQSIESNNFNNWRDKDFLPTAKSYTRQIEKTVSRMCSEFKVKSSGYINVSAPNCPYVSMPKKENRNNWQRFGDFFNGGKKRKELDRKYEKETWQAYKKAASAFLENFSKDALKSLNQYEKKVTPLISFPIPAENTKTIENRHILHQINSSVHVMNEINIMEEEDSDNNFLKKMTTQSKIALLFCKNYILCLLKIKK